MKKTLPVLIVSLCFVFSLFLPSEAPAPGVCYGVICDDGNECTVGSCQVIDGAAVCVYEEIPGCGDPCKDKDCDDFDACTIDSCNPDTGECEYQETICDDGDKCTDDSCNPQTGECEFEENDLCDCPPADPKTQGYWQHQCRALDLIGRSMGRVRLHEEWMAELDNIEEICDNLDADSNDMCSKAMKQLQALELNLMSERVAECNCIMPDGNIGDAIDDIEDWIAGGMCKDANDLADGINTGYIIIDCRDQEPPKPPTGVIIE